MEILFAMTLLLNKNNPINKSVEQDLEQRIAFIEDEIERYEPGSW